MTNELSELGWIARGRINLLRLKQETWLEESERATVDRAIAFLDKLIEYEIVPLQKKAAQMIGLGT